MHLQRHGPRAGGRRGSQQVPGDVQLIERASAQGFLALPAQTQKAPSVSIHAGLLDQLRVAGLEALQQQVQQQPVHALAAQLRVSAGEVDLIAALPDPCHRQVRGAAAHVEHQDALLTRHQ
mmetsp:Transcript_1732/g.2422  ORF Transcript_1732/g.2422 Transcript_1732/m.2422 type:complete len:121 (-) Transcript_1732:38-400(-)